MAEVEIPAPESELDEDYETVEYNHPQYGLIQYDVLRGMSDADAIKELEGMDLKSMFGLDTDDKAEGPEVEQLKLFENAQNTGLRDDKWYAHDSLEGGNQTIAFGHKLTDEEVRTGKITVGDKVVSWANGISREVADQLLTIDVGWAKKMAIQSLRKVGLDTIGDKVQALTSLIYNVGSGAWEKSKARRHLETGNLEDFMHEAFSPKSGFVNIQGEPSRGLIRRRGEEAFRFLSDELSKGGEAAMDIMKSINPAFKLVAQAETAATARGRPDLPKPKDPNPTMIKLEGGKVLPSDTEGVGSLLAGIIPAHYRAFAEDLIGDTLQTRGLEYFGAKEKEEIRILASKALEKDPTKTSGSITYNDYSDGYAGVSFKASVNPLQGAERDVKQTLGQIEWSIDHRGHMIFHDRFNFNDALPRGASILERLELAKKEMARGQGKDWGLYGYLRNVIAKPFGSPEGEGASFILDLGPKDGLLKSAKGKGKK